MANNKYYGYTPKTSKGNVGVPYGEDKRFVNQNPFEFQKGMDYELTDLGCSRLSESTIEEREKATEKVLKNLETHPSYYSCLIQYEVEYRNPVEGISKPSFSSYLKEMEDYQMVEADKEYKNDKMVGPKYKKEDYTVPYKTSPLKEAIKKEIVSILNENDEDKEPTRAQIKGIDKSIGDAKEALARAVAKVKELGPDIKKLAKETNDKIKKNPAGKADYLKVYMTNPDVKEFIKLRKMLKSADLL